MRNASCMAGSWSLARHSFGQGDAPSLGGLAVEVERDKGVEHVGYPYGQGGGHVAIDGKRGRDGLEQDVGEAQAQADAQVESHAAFGLSGREGDADEGEDERGEGHGYALVIFYLELFDVCEATLSLPVYVVPKLGAGEHLLLVLHDKEVGRLHVERGVYAAPPGDVLLHARHLAYHVIVYYPAVYGGGVVSDGACGEVGYKLFAFKLVEGEAVAPERVVLEPVDVGNHAGIHLQLDIMGCAGLARLVIPVLEIDAGHASLGNDVRAQEERGYGDDGGGHHVGAEHPLEAHARGKHGDDFRVLRQLGGKEYDGDEDKQGAEEVRKVGDEVHVVVEDDGMPRGFVGHEPVLFLVEVEHHRDGDDECDGKDIGAEELLDDVDVEPLQESAVPGDGLCEPPPGAFQRFVHSRVDIRLTIMGFQVAKSPARICRRASFASHR